MADKPKFGGIRVTLQPANSPNSELRNRRTEIVASGMCVCGKKKSVCNSEWDERLGVKGHTADSQSGVSEYERNRINIAAAIVEGLDPYCFKATALAEGYEPHWTPFLPAGTFPVPTQSPTSTGGPHGKRQGRSRGNRHGSRTGNGSTGSGRRGKRKPIRRKRR